MNKLFDYLKVIVIAVVVSLVTNLTVKVVFEKQLERYGAILDKAEKLQLRLEDSLNITEAQQAEYNNQMEEYKKQQVEYNMQMDDYKKQMDEYKRRQEKLKGLQ